MEGNISLEFWLQRLAPKTAKVHGATFRAWLRWLKENSGDFSEMSPDELIEYQKNTNNGTRYDLLDLVQSYVLSLKGRASSKTRAYSSIKSFFMHNRAELPRDPSFKIRSEVPPVQGTLTVEELLKVILGAKPVYQAIFLSMFQGGMGVAEFEYWNLNGWSDLRESLRNEDDVAQIKLPGRKSTRNKRTFYTFIGGDALEAIRNWLPFRPKDTKVIFTNQYGDPIRKNAVSLYWKRHLRKLGFVKPKKNGYSGNRYGKNLHEIRDVFRSQWEKSPAKGSVAEFMMGHVVDSLDYNKAYRDEAWAFKEYKKALPMLEIMSSSRPFGKVSEDEIEKVVKERTKELEAQLEKKYRKDMEDILTQRREFNLMELLVQAGADPEKLKTLYPHLVRQVDEAYEDKIRREGKT